jgi:hypothetical protein
MFALVLFLAMSVFAAVTSWTSRRSGGGITRRPYGNIYTDAPGARRDLPS